MAAALVAFVVPSADAAFSFNPTGGATTVGGFNPGTFTNIESLQFNAGNALAVGAIPLTVGKTFQLYYSTNLVGLNTASGPVASIAGLNAANGFEITEVSTFTEVVTSVATSASGTTVTFALSNTGPNLTRIFFQDLAAGGIKADAISGNGFNDGTVILTKTVTSNTSNFTDSSTTAGGPNPNVPLNGTSSGNYPGVLTHPGSGTTTINLNVGPYNGSFFQTPGLVTSSFSTNSTLPFSQISPSLRIADPNVTTGIATLVPNIGAINGQTGTDFLLQISGAAESFSAIPEPASVVMTLLGFAGVGAGSVITRRRRAQA